MRFNFRIEGGSAESDYWFQVMKDLFGFLGINFNGWVDNTEDKHSLFLQLGDTEKVFSELLLFSEPVRFYIPEQNMSTKKEVARFLASQLSKYKMKATFIEDGKELEITARTSCKFELNF